MKKIIIPCLFILLTSCSQKQKSINHFKFTLGNMAMTTNSIAFVNFIDVNNPKPNLVKLDSSNSTSINFGTYQLIVITFEGSEINSGEMRCGFLESAVINSPESTFNLNVSKDECALPRYALTILELKKGMVAKWDLDRFDLGHWGP